MKKLLTSFGLVGLVSVTGPTLVVSCSKNNKVYTLLTDQPKTKNEITILEKYLFEEVLLEIERITPERLKEFCNNEIFINYVKLNIKSGAVHYKILQFIIYAPESESLKLTKTWPWDFKVLDLYNTYEKLLSQDSVANLPTTDELKNYVTSTSIWAQTNNFGSVQQEWSDYTLAYFQNS